MGDGGKWSPEEHKVVERKVSRVGRPKHVSKARDISEPSI